MRVRALHGAFAASVATALLVGGSSVTKSFALHASNEAIVLQTGLPSVTPPSTPSAGERWLMATLATLDGAPDVRLPFVERGELHGTEAAARAFGFEAAGGQTLELTLERKPTAAAGERVYVEVFRVVVLLGSTVHQRLASLRPTASTLRTRLPSDGMYRVLVQTDGGENQSYVVTLELGAALPFPVFGANVSAVGSVFGASRDDGRRQHEGVDIFVKRLTPVLAVVAGRAMPRQDALGGNTVWLNTPGTSYYYAHLDHVAVLDGQPVRPGDVLGYVGNTGNASNMPSHLHFGVYRWGKEPVDPLPLLVARRFDAESRAALVAAGRP